MGNITNEQKARAYDEAIKVIKDNLDALNEITETGAEAVNIQAIKNCFYRAFPELKESKDENISKEIIKLVKFYYGSNLALKHTVSENEMIAWLEKQGEHANFRNKIQIGDKVTRNEDGVLVNMSQLNRVAKKDEKYGNVNPSEFDLRLNKLIEQFETLPKEELISSLSFYLNVVQNDGTYKSNEKQGEQKPAEWSEEDKKMFVNIKACLRSAIKNYSAELDWLKSLKNRYTWKPSEEQMDALETATSSLQSTTLESLYNDLKKLL